MSLFKNQAMASINPDPLILNCLRDLSQVLTRAQREAGDRIWALAQLIRAMALQDLRLALANSAVDVLNLSEVIVEKAISR